MHKCDGCKYKSEHQEMCFQPVGICIKEHFLHEAIKSYNAKECPFGVANGEKVPGEIERLMSKCKTLEEKLAKAERERDAALHDLKNSVDACMVCKWLGEECRSRNELNECAFEWRGLCPENTKEA